MVAVSVLRGFPRDTGAGGGPCRVRGGIGVVGGGIGVFPDVGRRPGRLTGVMLKLIGIAAVVVVGIVLLGYVAKAVLWIALIGVLLVIGRAAYQVVSSSRHADELKSPTS